MGWTLYLGGREWWGVEDWEMVLFEMVCGSPPEKGVFSTKKEGKNELKMD